ncbi:hypothetical protein Tco_0004772 [Tanacetum coccineum]
MDNSKRGTIPMQEILDLKKSQGESHWTVVKNILKYLRNTKDMFLVYSGNSEAELRVDFYCNTGFEIDIDDMKSLTVSANKKRKHHDNHKYKEWTSNVVETSMQSKEKGGTIAKIGG